MARSRTGKGAKTRGRIGRLLDVIGGWIEAAERVPVIGGFLGNLIKLGLVLLVLASAVALIVLFVFLQEIFLGSFV